MIEVNETYLAELSTGYRGWMVPPEKVGMVWDAAAPIIAKALPYTRGEFALEDLRQILDARAMQLWLVDQDYNVKAAFITEIVSYPRFRALRIVISFGEDHTKWKELWPLFEAFARSTSCSMIESFSRPGLTKLFKETGLRPTYNFVSCPVPEGMLQ